MERKISRRALGPLAEGLFDEAIEINSNLYDKTKDSYPHSPETTTSHVDFHTNELERRFPNWLRVIVPYFKSKYDDALCNYLAPKEDKRDYSKKVYVRPSSLTPEEISLMKKGIPGTCLRKPVPSWGGKK